MHRRGDGLAGRLLPALLVSLLGIGALIVAAAVSVVVARESSEPVEPPSVSAPVAADEQIGEPDRDVPDGPPITVTEFYPESANLSDCVGLVEKPGCGTGARGGWRQTAVFLALFTGLGIILWRVSRGIRANRAAIDAVVDTSDDRS